MSTVAQKTALIRLCVVSIALSMASGSVQTEDTSSTYSAKRMADGKRWTTRNLDVPITASYCYEDEELNCRRYGRLYTWETARRACQSLGNEWRLPTDSEWREMAQHYGGISEDSEDKGTVAYKQLLIGGPSGFGALLGGGRDQDGHYARLEAHGFYWAASESDPSSGVFYNFARGGQAFHRQSGGEKERAFSVRCVTE